MTLEKRRFVIGYVWPLLFFVSCASVPPICKPEGARQAGMAQAMRGEAFSPTAGGVCQDESVNVFKSNFQAGYQEGRNQFCSPAFVSQIGRGQGQQGQANQFSQATYQICDSPSDLKASYQAGYSSGLDEFCSESAAQSQGSKPGNAGTEANFAPERYAICGKKRLSRIRDVYQRSYRAALQNFCLGTGLEAEAFQQGAAGNEAIDPGLRFRLCSLPRRQSLLAVYRSQYDRGLGQFCAAASLLQSAQTQARQSSNGLLPSQFAKCLAKFPDTNTHYQNAFNQERKSFVESECTYQKGIAQGQADSGRSNEKTTAIPSFCDSNLFAVYLSGYLEGWKQIKDQMCNSTAAYQQGLHDGATGFAANYNAPANCPFDYQNNLQQKYLEAYSVGSTRRVASQTVAFNRPTQALCNSPLDCTGGQSCRNRGDGVSMCMGNGQRGYFCSGSLDCASGLFCRGATSLKFCQ